MSTLYESHTTGADATYNIAMTSGDAQTFTPQVDHIITSVKLKLYRLGASYPPGIITVSIRAVDATTGLPTGADLCSGTTDGNTLTENTAGEWREITFTSGFLLLSGTAYAIYAWSAAIAAYWRTDTDNGYASGKQCTTADGGVTWLDIGGGLYDLMFEEWGDPEGAGDGASGGGVIFPSEAITRVTNLIHRYVRRGGVYTLEVNLGEIISDFGLPEWLSGPTSAMPGVRSEKEIMQEVTEIRNKIADELGVIQAQQRFPTTTEQAIMSEVTELRNQIADELGQIQKKAAALAPSPTFIPEALARMQAPRRAAAPAPTPKRYTPEPVVSQTAETRRRLEEARRKLAESMPGW